MEESEQREKLLKGATELFMRYGLRSVSMDDIARQLGVSKKTIYQYFTDKDDMVATVVKSHMEREQEQFEEITRVSKDAVDEMVRLSYRLKESMRDTNPTVLYDMQKYHPRAWGEWLSFKNKVIRESIVRNLRSGMGEGYFRADLHLDIIANMRLEAVQMGFDQNIFPRDKYSLPDVQVQLFEHFVQGVLTDKGRVLYQQYKEKTVELSNP
ncbi:TetR/AcrR family transcriptional regulator [Fulvivirgaceae bacterium PWU5]|uniref:TetR/AcrR family transcriptional regulator n=1 Tax=Dawidia cretensis TaxID=2782350 RepID=A0AAP2GW42_9BACT|nr:TetR/AcrR family transcriptional regulator [Dawidia cretensis]MBT1711615.1 TetR/AcrR family transcriptional regulator [Dawidia cretensis]